MSLTKGEFSTCCAWLFKNEILQLPAKSLCEDFLGGEVNFSGRVFQAFPSTPKSTRICQVPCSGTDVFGVTQQTRDPGFQVVIASQDHVLVFLY